MSEEKVRVHFKRFPVFLDGLIVPACKEVRGGSGGALPAEQSERFTGNRQQRNHYHGDHKPADKDRRRFT